MSDTKETIIGLGIWVVLGYGIYSLFSFDPVDFVKEITPIEAMVQNDEVEQTVGDKIDDVIAAFKTKVASDGNDPEVLEKSLETILENSTHITSYSWNSFELPDYNGSDVVGVELTIESSRVGKQKMVFPVKDSVIAKWFGNSLILTPREVEYLLIK